MGVRAEYESLIDFFRRGKGTNCSRLLSFPLGVYVDQVLRLITG